MLSALAFIFTLGLLVTVHEYGHFQVARWCGVKVLKFSVGFGKPLWVKKFGADNTEFIIAAIPLGGYVKMLDEREFASEESPPHYAEADLKRAFNRQHVAKRIAIVLAGPVANLLLAIFLFWLLFMAGVIGMKPIIGNVLANSPAALAGLHEQDMVLAVNGSKVTSWGDFVQAVKQNPNEALNVAVQRQTAQLSLKLTPKPIMENGVEVGVIGVAVADAQLITLYYSPLESLIKASQTTWNTAFFSLRMLKDMLTGHASWKNMGGIVTVASYAGQSAHTGLKSFISFLALISISIGVLNLLPIPVLDGGHLMYYMIEILTGKPVSESIMIIGQKIGFSLLGFMMILALYNDMNRLITG